MNNLICISTGAVYKMSEDMNEKIEMLKEFSPDGIELCFANPQHLIDFQITAGNLSYLHGLKYISIHAPWMDSIRYGANERSDRILRVIENLYNQIKAQNVVFHIDHFDKIDIFKEFNFIVSLENVDWKSGIGKNIEEVGGAIQNNVNFKFTFDFAHALTVLPDSIPDFISRFKDKIIQVHLSYHSRELLDHWFLHKFDSEEMQNLVSYLRPLNVPIVLECVASNRNELSLIREEMEHMREVFSS